MSFFILRGRSSSVECRFDLRNCISDSIQENPEQSHWKHHSLLRFLSIHKQVYMQIISKSLIQVLLGFFFSITSTYYIHINLSVALSVICVLSAKFGTHVSKIPTFFILFLNRYFRRGWCYRLRSMMLVLLSFLLFWVLYIRKLCALWIKDWFLIFFC